MLLGFGSICLIPFLVRERQAPLPVSVLALPASLTLVNSY